MDAESVKKILRNEGIGGFMGRGIRLFDHDFMSLPLSEIDSRCEDAMAKLAQEGLTTEDYRENGVDCDNFALWIQSEVTKQWAIDSKPKAKTPALLFGRAALPGHEINIAICEGNIFTWNYGQLFTVDLKTIKEVEFK